MVLRHTRACGISHCSQKTYVNSRRLNKEHVGCLLNVSTGKANVVRAAFASIFLTCVLGGKVRASEEPPAMDEDQDRDSSENLTCTKLRPVGLCLRALGRAGRCLESSWPMYFLEWGKRVHNN